jgi:preprotein translocase subunit SecB
MSDQPDPGQTPQAPAGDDPDAQGAAQPAERQQPPLVIQAQYVKDLSFEAPNAPTVFSQLQQNKPDMQVRVEVHSRPLSGQSYEVVLNIRADCKAGETTAFMLELAYGGVFAANVAADALNPVLMIECPRILFPFARQIIAGATLDGGFLPLMLAPIDFVGLYQQQLREQQRRQADGGDDTKLA